MAFVLFNPPKGSKKSKAPKRKKSGARKLSKTLAAYNRFRKSYKRTHKGASATSLRKAWSGAKSMYMRKKTRNRSKAKSCVRRSSIPSMVARTVGRTVCDLKALAAARKKYCKVVGASSGVGALAKTEQDVRERNLIHSASELRTPSGARIFSVASNPHRRHPMAKRRGKRGRRGLRLLGFNPASVLSMSEPTTTGKVTDAFKPSNLAGLVPIFAGAVINNMLTSLASKYVPYTGKGLGNYALGLASAGIVGSAAAMINPKFGKAALIGGAVEVASRVFADVQRDGMKALTLGQDLNGWGPMEGVSDGGTADQWSGGFQGMNDFVTPQGIQSVIQSGPVMSQYSLPAATAAAGQAQLTAGPTGPSVAAASAKAKTMADYESSVLSEVISDDSGF